MGLTKPLGMFVVYQSFWTFLIISVTEEGLVSIGLHGIGGHSLSLSAKWKIGLNISFSNVYQNIFIQNTFFIVQGQFLDLPKY